ncbi:hypothetical protein LF817_17230 [Halobacillus sp. A1]|uniref:hypothetical protein n=1 Tax=Halobacillus sp. A1 TaxID=2880262 RepID=UPI0020A65B5A|nr:hypothetical protein [Halobacillus sp. A1]MCP3033070.1 hypothetical protein [Halobacillus sp. A1]
MSVKTRLIISIAAAIFLTINCFIAFSQDQTLQWLWLVVALSSLLNCVIYYVRYKNYEPSSNQ